MFGEIIQPINQLSANVSGLNGQIYDLKMAIQAQTEAVLIQTDAINKLIELQVQIAVLNEAKNENDRG